MDERGESAPCGAARIGWVAARKAEAGREETQGDKQPTLSYVKAQIAAGARLFSVQPFWARRRPARAEYSSPIAKKRKQS